ncbi:fibronectin type III domain-containing protein [Patescibacteria group bacterium]|nr:fibronectin type III domain-containing protein [Patescibacteria group bacterium]
MSKKLQISFLILLLLLSFIDPEKLLAISKLTNHSFQSALGSEWTINTGSKSSKTTQNSYTRVSDASSQDGDGYDFKGQWTGGGTNNTWTKCIWQTFTPGADVKAKLRGYYKRIKVNALDSNQVKLEILTGVSTCANGSVIATAFNGNTVANDTTWQGGTFTSEFTLTSGTTYYIRAFWTGVADLNEVGGGIIDNIQLNVAPANPSDSSIDGSTNAALTWTGSSGTPALHGTTPYKIYRNTSSPVTTGNFLANSATNSYTDSTTTGNTDYYFAISDLDTGSSESPLSAELHILTRPAAPTVLNFTSVQSNSLTLNWTAPSGGATSYKIERCQGSGCSNFAEVGTGVTATNFPDSGLTGSTLYRYRVRGVNSSGSGVYSAIAEQTTAADISISITTDGSVNFNTLPLNTTKDTTASGTNDVQTVRVDSGTANLNVKSTNFTQGVNTWSLNSTNGAGQVKWEYSKDGSNWSTFIAADTLYGLDTSVASPNTRNIYLRLTMPTSTNSYNQFSSNVTVVASAP